MFSNVGGKVKAFGDDDTLWDIYRFVFGFYGQAGFCSYRNVTGFEYRFEGPLFVAGVNFDDGFDRIYLSVESTSNWCQIMYQMSHECVHQIIYRLACVNGLCEHRWVSWIEELIAECCAVAFLKYAGENWSKCRLSKRNFKYQFNVQKYLRDLVLDSKRSNNGVLLTCPAHESLLNVDAGFCDHRDWHAREVMDLFNRFDVSFLPGLFTYTRYVNFDMKLLDIDAYLRNCSWNKMVEYLCELQTAICDGSNLRLLRE